MRAPSPSTATGAASASSSAVMKRPSAICSPAMPWNVGSTPKTVGVSANGFGISFDGVNRLRAVDAPTPSTVDLITRMSARLSRAETCRSRWNAC